jgi:pimeloyl-ACP methyl ester carboxylesterase
MIQRRVLRHDGLTFTALTAGDGPTVLLLHGFPDHAYSFAPLVETLARVGYRAVAPMLRGYEPGSQPRDGQYRVAALAEDVVAWLDDLEVDQAHLVGHDWGAVICYATAATAPTRVLSLATLAVPYVGRMPVSMLSMLPVQLRKSWYALFFQLPGLPEALLAKSDWQLVRWLWRSWSPGFELDWQAWASLRETVAAPGVASAMLAYYRQNLLHAGDMFGGPPIAVPTLALTGGRDGCIDTRFYDLAMHADDFPAGLRIERVQDVGHFLHLEAPELVAEMLVEWLGSRAEN